MRYALLVSLALPAARAYALPALRIVPGASLCRPHPVPRAVGARCVGRTEDEKPAEIIRKGEEEEEMKVMQEVADAAEAARNPDARAAAKAAALSAAEALRAEMAAAGESHPAAKALGAKGAKAKPALKSALKKPKGTIALIGEGTLVDATTLGGFDLNDAEYLSSQFRSSNMARADPHPSMHAPATAPSHRICRAGRRVRHYRRRPRSGRRLARRHRQRAGGAARPSHP